MFSPRGPAWLFMGVVFLPTQWSPKPPTSPPLLAAAVPVTNEGLDFQSGSNRDTEQRCVPLTFQEESQQPSCPALCLRTSTASATFATATMVVKSTAHPRQPTSFPQAACIGSMSGKKRDEGQSQRIDYVQPPRP